MTYDEAIEATVSAREAQIEIEAHGLNWTDFLADVGERATYSGKDVLDWLGY